jgi:hypothetical protein
MVLLRDDERADGSLLSALPCNCIADSYVLLRETGVAWAAYHFVLDYLIPNFGSLGECIQ